MLKRSAPDREDLNERFFMHATSLVRVRFVSFGRQGNVFSTGAKAIRPEPEWRDEMQTFLIGARNVELLSTLDSQNMSTCGQRPVI